MTRRARVLWLSLSIACACAATPRASAQTSPVPVAAPQEPAPVASEPAVPNAAPANNAPADEVVELPPPEPRPTTESLAASGDPFGDGPADLGFGVFSVRALLQTRYTSTFGFHSDNTRASYVVREEYLVEHDDGFAINRMFLRLGAAPTPYLAFKAVLDFAELIDDDAESMVKQAYATLRAVPDRFEIAAGVLKLPYSTLELDASARYELADFGLADSLVKDLGFAGRDVGVQLMGAPLSKPKYLVLTAGVFAGHAHGEQDSPLGAIGARVESKPLKGLRLGADFVAHPQTVTYLRPFETSGKDVLPDPPDPLYPREQQWHKGWAWSADARYERKRLMLRAELMAGDRVDVFTRYGAETFGAVWALAAYRFRLGPVELMPAASAEWLDANRERATGLYRELSVGVTMLYPEHVRLLFDLTRTDVQAHSPLLDQPKPWTDPPYMALSNTRFITQLQIEI